MIKKPSQVMVDFHVKTHHLKVPTNLCEHAQLVPNNGIATLEEWRTLESQQVQSIYLRNHG